MAKASLPDCFQLEFSDAAVSPNYLFTRSHDPTLTISLVFIRKPIHFASLILILHPNQTSQESQEGEETNGIILKIH